MLRCVLRWTAFDWASREIRVSVIGLLGDNEIRTVLDHRRE